MVKSTQIKIILIIVLLAILMFGSFGAYSIIRLNNLQTSIVEKDILMQEINEIKLVLAIITISFIIISFVIMWFSRKIISQPILRLIQSAKQINEENRNAEYRCCVTSMMPNGDYHQEIGVSKGKISKEIIGELKKPYFYSVFILEGETVAFSGLKGKELDNTYRYNAIRKSLKRF